MARAALFKSWFKIPWMIRWCSSRVPAYLEGVRRVSQRSLWLCRVMRLHMSSIRVLPEYSISFSWNAVSSEKFLSKFPFEMSLHKFWWISINSSFWVSFNPPLDRIILTLMISIASRIWNISAISVRVMDRTTTLVAVRSNNPMSINCCIASLTGVRLIFSSLDNSRSDTISPEDNS